MPVRTLQRLALTDWAGRLVCFVEEAWVTLEYQRRRMVVCSRIRHAATNVLRRKGATLSNPTAKLQTPMSNI